jgi:hypothetical protein
MFWILSSGILGRTLRIGSCLNAEFTLNAGICREGGKSHIPRSRTSRDSAAKTGSRFRILGRNCILQTRRRVGISSRHRRSPHYGVAKVRPKATNPNIARFIRPVVTVVAPCLIPYRHESTYEDKVSPVVIFQGSLATTDGTWLYLPYVFSIPA